MGPVASNPRFGGGFGLTEPKAVATEAEGSFGDLVK